MVAPAEPAPTGGMKRPPGPAAAAGPAQAAELARAGEPAPPAEPAPAKADPAALVLRGRPPGIARFRKRAVVLVAAMASTALAGVSWFALRSPRPAIFAEADRRPEGSARPPEILASAPGAYSDIPRLGPPLPGDLGRPILEQSRAVESGAGNSDAAAVEHAAAAAEMERQRAASEQSAARRSGLLVRGQAAPVALADIGGDVSRPSARPTPNAQDLGSPRVADAPPRKLDFLALPDAGGDTNPHRRTPAVSIPMISAGSTIAASLVTGLNSDLPGLVLAQVTENAYDSATGRVVLIPQGSRLVGRYDSVIAFGQRRALVIWQRILFPDGSSVRIDNWPATDQAGYAGLADGIDFHGWQMLKGVALSALLGIGSELGVDGQSDLVAALRETTQQNAARAGDQLVARNLEVQPTIRVRPGWPLRVIAHKDLILPPWRETE